MLWETWASSPSVDKEFGMDFSVKEICQSTGARMIVGDHDTKTFSCTIDSREVEKGGLFCAVVGERVDGNDFCKSAIEAGASCVALTRDPTEEECAFAQEHGASIVRISDGDPERFLLSLASAYRERISNCVVVAVTGSAGKTTTKEYIAALLAKSYKVHATKGNLNSFFGVSLTLLSAPEDTQVIVMEMGMNQRGEIFRETRTARPNIAVITNVGTAHIGILGSRREIAEAKAEILAGMESTPFVPGGGMRLFMHGDDDFFELIGRNYAPRSNVDAMAVGLGEGNELYALNVQLDAMGKASFDVVYPDGEREQARLSIPGTHTVIDALLALAVADLMRVPRAAALEALEATESYKMRMQVLVGEGTPRVIDDSYNASPSSMAAALDVLASMECTGRRIAVLGEMGELGQDERLLHGYVGAYAAAKGFDMLVTIGSTLAGEIRNGASVCGMSSDKMEAFADVKSALESLKPILREDDLVLVKASRSSGLDEFAKGVIEGC